MFYGRELLECLSILRELKAMFESEDTKFTSTTGHVVYTDGGTSRDYLHRCPSPDCDKTFRTKRGMRIHVTRKH